MEHKGVIDAQVLQDIVRRIVDVAEPERIVVFGSAATGQLGPNSDVDVLVIRRVAHRRKLAAEIYTRLISVGVAGDVVVVTREDVERFGDSPVTVIAPALRQGRVIYAA